MEYFLEVFGGVTIGRAAVIIGAAAFLFACYKKVAKYFKEKTTRDIEKNDKIQKVIDQAAQYPNWHQQSINAQERFNEVFTQLSDKIDAVKNHLEEMEVKNDENRATDCRYRILRFNDEILNDQRHTKEHFDQILEDVTKYEKYCETHPNYSNDKAVMAIRNIKRIYEKCMNENTFL